MEKIKQKVEQVLGKDHHDDTTGTTGTTYGTSTHGTTTGTYGSDPTGPHDSRMANKADPRVDSDRYGGHGNTASAGGYGQHSGVTGTGSSHVPGGTHGSDPTGPHDTRMANKLDPRVDSDRIGGHGNTTGAGGYGTHSSTDTGLRGGAYGSDPSGPHDSRLANKADPRVDSDRYGGHGNTAGTGGYGHSTGLTGNTHSSHTAGTYGSDPTGPHDSRMGNKLDPRIDSDRVGSQGNAPGTGGYGSGHSTGIGSDPYGSHSTGMTGETHGTHHHSSHLPGPADSTAGPHNSNLLNKADPRVDSDLDGSKKIGGDRTFG